MLEYFPFSEPRDLQVRTLNTIERAFQNSNTVLLESPVGTGKSPMIITKARQMGDSYILTPRIQLQDQYYDDFKQYVVTLKGKARYPCIDTEREFARDRPADMISLEVARGNLSSLYADMKPGCDDGNCTRAIDPGAYVSRCEARTGYRCPYLSAVDVANQSPHIVANLHGFIAHAQLEGRFEKRPLIAVDECHDMADTVRSALAKEFFIRGHALEHPGDRTQAEWVTWLEGYPPIRPRFMPDWPNYMKEYEEWMRGLPYMGRCVVTFKVVQRGTYVTFTPLYVQRACRDLIFSRGDKRLLASGTIFSKAMFCHEVGLDPQEVAHIRVNSTFPVRNRPVTLLPQAVPLGAANWDQNFGKLVDMCRTVMEKYPEHKGLIHTSSYSRAKQLQEALGGRTITHTSDNFNICLEDFFFYRDNRVLISPVCQQGVDFKDDRARFQIITSVPYLYAGDPVVEALKEDPRWYSLKALIVFSQQLGRPVRNDNDWGATYLTDSRFRNFLRGNRRLIPDWQWSAFHGV